MARLLPSSPARASAPSTRAPHLLGVQRAPSRSLARPRSALPQRLASSRGALSLLAWLERPACPCAGESPRSSVDTSRAVPSALSKLRPPPSQLGAPLLPWLLAQRAVSAPSPSFSSCVPCVFSPLEVLPRWWPSSSLMVSSSRPPPLLLTPCARLLWHRSALAHVAIVVSSLVIASRVVELVVFLV
jgi:hypothetical protein